MNTHIFRLHPNTPLRESLEQYCAKHTPQGAAVVTCVGSLQIARTFLFFDLDPDEVTQQVKEKLPTSIRKPLSNLKRLLVRA